MRLPHKVCNSLASKHHWSTVVGNVCLNVFQSSFALVEPAWSTDVSIFLHMSAGFDVKFGKAQPDFLKIDKRKFSARARHGCRCVVNHIKFVKFVELTFLQSRIL